MLALNEPIVTSSVEIIGHLLHLGRLFGKVWTRRPAMLMKRRLLLRLLRE
jgi:hypothetical protein